MKLYKLTIFILIVFFKTETLFSENNFFSVNNIQLEKKDKISNKTLADEAIRLGFKQLSLRILLQEDKKKLSDLNFSSIKQLVVHYRITNNSEKEEKLNFSVTFDKDKLHNLFYKKGISYSQISNKELYILPVLIKKNEIFIFNNNFFYKSWNTIFDNDLIEFILPIENIEIIQNINKHKTNLLNLELNNLFKEYKDKNLALILIEDKKSSGIKVFIKSQIEKKNISKNVNFKRVNTNTNKFNEQVIIEIKKELINLIKSENLIDIRTPSFLNVKLNLNNGSNLVELNTRIKKIGVIENIYVQEFNKDYMELKIKYLGKLDKIIDLLKIENIDLQLINDHWIIRTL